MVMKTAGKRCGVAGYFLARKMNKSAVPHTARAINRAAEVATARFTEGFNAQAPRMAKKTTTKSEGKT